MKKLISLILAVLSIILLVTSCADNTNHIIEESEHIITSALPLLGVALKSNPDSLAVYKNIAFLLSEGKVSRLDLVTGDLEDVLDASTALAIGCDGSRFAVVSTASVTVYDYDGLQLTEIKLDNEVSDIPAVAVGGNFVLFGSGNEKEDDLYLVDLDSNKVSLLPNTWKPGVRDAVLSEIKISSDEEALLNYSFNHGWTGWNVMLMKYDFTKDEITESMTYENMSYSAGCHAISGDFYYLNQSGEYRFIARQFKDGTSGNVLYLDTTKLTGVSSSDSSELLYSDGESFVLFDKTSNTIVAAGIDTELPPVVILGLEGGKYSEIIARYTAETGRQIETITYPESEYNDRLRTKLLANEADFDLFIADNTVLRSILENSAYESLDGYSDVSQNFDNVLAEGIRELMTQDNRLFGIPLKASYYAAFAKLEPYGIPENWSIDDMFNLCDELSDSDKKLFVDRYQLTQIVKNLIQDMISQAGRIDTDELIKIFENLKYYNDLGVLCDGGNTAILSYGSAYFSSLNLTFANLPDMDGYVNCPARSGVSYINLENSMLMNRSSENKDAAAEFLAFLTSKESVYDNRCLDIFIGKDVNKNSVYAELDDTQRELLAFSMTIYENAKPSTIDGTVSLPEFIANKVLFPFLDGEITPDEAAQKIIDEVAYTYFE